MAKFIPLTQLKFAIVDDGDFDDLCQHEWYAALYGSKFYAVRMGAHRKIIQMHRLLMGFPPTRVDHENSNSLDNRRLNLRVCTPSENGANKVTSSVKKTSKFKGVSWRCDRSKWRAVIGLNNKMVYIGLFETEREAAMAYDVAAVALFHEFALTNRELGLLT